MTITDTYELAVITEIGPRAIFVIFDDFLDLWSKGKTNHQKSIWDPYPSPDAL